MFGKFFGQVAVPFLLASTVQQQQQQQYGSLREIRTSMDQMYQDLVDNPGNVTQRITPTLQFSFVSPPIDGQSTWRTSKSSGSRGALDTPETTGSDNDDKPIAIYLPGLDGTGISAFTHQFDDLANTFELWRMIIDTADRSEFRQVLQAVVDFMDENVLPTGREVILIGESFGGVLASAVALKLQARRSPVDGLVLVNPATAFDETNWDTIVPLLASLQYLANNDTNTNATSTVPTPYSLAGGMALSYLIPDNNQLRRIVDVLVNAVGLPSINSTINNIGEDTMQDMMGMLEILEERLPAGTLQHRVNQWLVVGAPLVNARLKDLQTPTLVVAGDQDRIMPSGKEVDRLAKVIPSCEKLLVRGRGHFVLDENVNLTEAIIYSDIDPLKWKDSDGTTKSRYDPVYDWTLPPQEEVDEIIQSQVKPLRDIHSPVFLSTDANGKRWRGLSKIPLPSTATDERQGPILFVANHQFFGLDLNLIIAELLEQRNLICRGLAHPIVFNQTKFPELRGRTPGLRSTVSNGPAGGINSFGNFQKFGAVAVTPRNYYKVMQSGQNALLFPGGVKDVFQTDPRYPLLWPQDKTDFVRTAARFNATIVPLSAVGMLESTRVVVQAKDLGNVPFIGQRIKEAGGGFAPAARFDAPEGETDPLPPIALPSMPQRNYFIFGKPFSTQDIDPKDKDACAVLYKNVVAETRRGLDDILHARSKDPFSDTPSRIAYEQLTRKQAPTFGIDVLNRRR